MTIPQALRGVGVKWIRTVDSYGIPRMLGTLREALTTRVPGLKVIIAKGECQLERQRRERPLMRARAAAGRHRGAAALRRRSRRVHGRSLLHAPQRLPVADAAREPRSAARGSDRPRGRDLRGLWRVRRGRARRGALPVVLRGARSSPTPAGGRAARRAAVRRHWPSRRVLRGPSRRREPAPSASSAVLIPAVGGQGGGVLSEWIVDAALDRRAPRPRHLDPRRRPAHRLHDVLRRALRRAPTPRSRPFSLYPVPGALDVLLAPEFLEVGRMIELGFRLAGAHHRHRQHAPSLLDPREDRDRPRDLSERGSAARGPRPSRAAPDRVRRAGPGARARHRGQRDPARRAGGQRGPARARRRVPRGDRAQGCRRWRRISRGFELGLSLVRDAADARPAPRR